MRILQDFLYIMIICTIFTSLIGVINYVMNIIWEEIPGSFEKMCEFFDFNEK